MQYNGTLNKMSTSALLPVKYILDFGDDFLLMNQMIGKQLAFRFCGKYICHCGKEVAGFYRNNFCRECFFSNPAAGDAIFRPELSKAHLGVADRDLAIEMAYQLQPHVVYLAQSGGLKVGVTRAKQKLNRWMDQGASQAIVIAETENRFLAGSIEVFLKNHVADKTNWQRMLKNQTDEIDILAEKKRLTALLPADLQNLICADDTVYNFTYPVENYPLKVTSVNLAKTPDFSGTLVGIRGQYLLFDNSGVLNVRSHEGYVVGLSFL